MNIDLFNKLVEETKASIDNLLLVKGAEYAGSDDRLANFKRGASLTGCSALQVCFIYMSKHYDAVASYVRDSTRPSSEPIEGRLDDLINYCILMKGLIREGKTLVFNPGGVYQSPNEVSDHLRGVYNPAAIPAHGSYKYPVK